VVDFFVFRVRTNCIECGESLIVDGPTTSLPCPACGSASSLNQHSWKKIFDQRKMVALQEGWTISSAVDLHGGFPFFVTHGPKRPSCGACGSVLDLATAPPGTDGEVACPCGGSTSTFPAPQWLREVDPSAMQLFGAVRQGVAPPATASVGIPDATKPVSFACPECGANLRIASDSKRILGCDFCQANLYLPDPLWRALHPAKKRTPWYVAFG